MRMITTKSRWKRAHGATNETSLNMELLTRHSDHVSKLSTSLLVRRNPSGWTVNPITNSPLPMQMEKLHKSSGLDSSRSLIRKVFSGFLMNLFTSLVSPMWASSPHTNCSHFHLLSDYFAHRCCNPIKFYETLSSHCNQNSRSVCSH